MKRILAATCAALLLALSPTASAASTAALTINGVDSGNAAMTTIYHDTTYVSLRTVSAALDSDAQISWENGIASVSTSSFLLTARPGDDYLTVNGEIVPIPHGVMLVQNRTLVPVRVLAQVFGASVSWHPASRTVAVNSNTADESGQYDPDDLYWLSRIISAESRGEPLEGKIAVGNVVLNRVQSPDFPDTIYDVIFDSRWGGQFEPVRNGTIYEDPTEESVEAARQCLSGVNVVGGCLYFLAPSLAQNFWVPQNRTYAATIGCHDFYL